MGWWKINCRGGVSESTPSGKPGDCSLLNAVPGRDTPEDHYGGDEPADAIQRAVDEVMAIWRRDWNREPYIEELDGVWRFVTSKYRDAETGIDP